MARDAAAGAASAAASARAPLGPASAAAGGGLGARLPEPQMVEVEWPDGRRGAHFARLDPASGCLRLRPIAKGAAGKVDVGAEASIQLDKCSRKRLLQASDDAATVAGGGFGGAWVLELLESGGDALVRMRLDAKEQAQAWIRGIDEVRRLRCGGAADAASAPLAEAAASASSRASPKAAAGGAGGGAAAAGAAESGETAALVAMLRELCGKLEQRGADLEVGNRRKEQQLLKLHERLEEALLVLQAGQATYSKQQKVMEEQAARIEALKQLQARQLQASSPSATPGGGAGGAAATAPRREEGCRDGVGAAAAAEGSAGGARPAAAAAEADDSSSESAAEAGACADGADTDADTEAEAGGSALDAGAVAPEALMGLAHRTDALQARLEELSRSAGASGDLEGPGGVAGAFAAATQVMQSAPEVLAHLHALIAEKDRLEAHLQGEQAELEQQLQGLHAQMREAEAAEAAASSG